MDINNNYHTVPKLRKLIITDGLSFALSIGSRSQCTTPDYEIITYLALGNYFPMQTFVNLCSDENKLFHAENVRRGQMNIYNIIKHDLNEIRKKCDDTDHLVHNEISEIFSNLYNIIISLDCRDNLVQAEIGSKTVHDRMKCNAKILLVDNEIDNKINHILAQVQGLKAKTYTYTNDQLCSVYYNAYNYGTTLDISQGNVYINAITNVKLDGLKVGIDIGYVGNMLKDMVHMIQDLERDVNSKIVSLHLKTGLPRDHRMNHQMEINRLKYEIKNQKIRLDNILNEIREYISTYGKHTFVDEWFRDREQYIIIQKNSNNEKRVRDESGCAEIDIFEKKPRI